LKNCRQTFLKNPLPDGGSQRNLGRTDDEGEKSPDDDGSPTTNQRVIHGPFAD
jgi:hypothetical protein